MKRIMFGVLLMFMSAQLFAQNSAVEHEIISISKDKWQWMADKNVDKLGSLFHDKSKFVHMSGPGKKMRNWRSLKPEVSGIKRPQCMI